METASGSIRQAFDLAIVGGKALTLVVLTDEEIAKLDRSLFDRGQGATRLFESESEPTWEDAEWQ
jgi:hypothetical protein